MTIGREGPERTSRGPFGLWTSSKALENNEQPVGTSTASNGSAFDIAALQQARKDRISSRLRRNSSRFLTLIRVRRDSSNGETRCGPVPLDLLIQNPVVKTPIPEPETPPTLEQTGNGSQSYYPALTKDTLACQHTVSRPQENIPVTPGSSNPHTPDSDELPELVTATGDKRQEEERQEATRPPSQPQETPVDDDRKPYVQRSPSSSNLAALLSNKLSTAFVNSTVIHRTNRSRPSVRAHQPPQVVDAPLCQEGDNTDSSNYSTTPSGGSCWSSDPKSTPPTSDESVTPPDNSKSFPWSTNGGNEGLPQDFHLRRRFPAQEPPDTPPSIATAEAVANTKIFFETYFNTVYSHLDARSQRQQELERYLYSMPLSPEEQDIAWRNWIRQEREYLRQCRVLKTRCHHDRRGEVVSAANYEVVKVLGNGSFGVVRLVREKGNEGDEARPNNRRHAPGRKGVYAMKVIRKSEMLRTSQEGHLRAERDFLVASANSRWVVPLIASFQDSQNLYLILEYMVGGDFLGLLFRKGILLESTARWYIAQMILCVEEAHKLLWIHRDVKPDNFLISSSGHLKIADFGLAFDGHWAHDQGYYHNHRY